VGNQLLDPGIYSTTKNRTDGSDELLTRMPSTVDTISLLYGMFLCCMELMFLVSHSSDSRSMTRSESSLVRSIVFVHYNEVDKG
jgi:hypothetical protein